MPNLINIDSAVAALLMREKTRVRVGFYGRPMEYGKPLYICRVVSFFLLSSFSSPILSGNRLDVYHTSTHGVALVPI